MPAMAEPTRDVLPAAVAQAEHTVIQRELHTTQLELRRSQQELRARMRELADLKGELARLRAALAALRTRTPGALTQAVHDSETRSSALAQQAHAANYRAVGLAQAGQRLRRALDAVQRELAALPRNQQPPAVLRALGLVRAALEATPHTDGDGDAAVVDADQEGAA